MSDLAQLTVRKFAHHVAVKLHGDLASSIVEKEAQDEQAEDSQVSLAYDWQNMFFENDNVTR